jgi:hypothetical protein
MSKNRTQFQQTEAKKTEEQVFEEQAALEAAAQEKAVQKEEQTQAKLAQDLDAPAAPETTITMTVAEPVVIAKPAFVPEAAPVVNQVIPQPAAAPVAQFSAMAQMSLNVVDEYVVLMAPRKPVTVQEGCRNQIALYRAITGLINRTEEDFEAAFAALLAKFEQHRTGAMSEENVFRFFESMELPENDRKAFQRLLNLIKVAGPVAGRSIAVKQINFNETLKFGLTESGRQRILGFFSK